MFHANSGTNLHEMSCVLYGARNVDYGAGN